MQDYIFKTVRAAAILTNGYVAGTVLGIDELQPKLHNQLVIYVDFTIGSLTSASVKVEFSDDNSDYYQETFGSIAAGVETDTVGVHTLSATGKYRIPIPCKDGFVKISAIGTGTVTSSSMAIKAVFGTA